MYARGVPARSPVQRLLCSALTLALAVPTTAATSLVPTVVLAEPAGDDEAALAEARAMFERGRSKYDTFDYEGAIDLWQQAYAKVPESQAGVRNAMVYNIALAQEKAYDVDRDVAHLRQAVLLLQSWQASYKAMFKKTPETEAEVTKAQDRIDELQARIEKIEAGVETSTLAPSSTEGAQDSASADIEFDTGYTPPPEVRRERQKAQAADKSESKIAIGWTVGGIGAIVFLAGVAGTVGSSRIGDRSDRRAGVGGSIGVTVLGGAMIAAGAVLLSQGYKEKKAIQQGKYSLAPYTDGTQSGLSFSMRF